MELSTPDKEFQSVQYAFSKQAEHYDADDISNPILLTWRKQVYSHVAQFLKPESKILELNAGTGIDAIYFAKQGHYVHATDVAPGMIKKIGDKIFKNSLNGRLTVQQCSYDSLDQIKNKKFDYVFSNFGGLNCIEDLNRITKLLPTLLNPEAHVTWVIMPPICPWEIFTLAKGNKYAFRRLNKNGTIAHLENYHFKTYYHSLRTIKKAFGQNFKFKKSEGLGSLSAPPSSLRFVQAHPKVYSSLAKLDALVRNNFPFNRWADHIIVTMQSKIK